MKPVTETALLLVVVIVFASLGMAAHFWTDSPLTALALYGAPMVAGFACGRITGMVARASA